MSQDSAQVSKRHARMDRLVAAYLKGNWTFNEMVLEVNWIKANMPCDCYSCS